MAKSLKKHPIIKYAPTRAYYQKKEANHTVRRIPIDDDRVYVTNGKQYRKLYNPWDIHDCVYRYFPWIGYQYFLTREDDEAAAKKEVQKFYRK